MPNLPIPDLPGGTVESTDNILGVKSNEPGQDLVLFPYGSNLAAKVDVSTYDADQAVQDADIATNATDIATNVGDIATNAAAIAATEIVADGAVQKSGDTMTGPLTVPALTATGIVTSERGTPEYRLVETDQPSDGKWFRITADAGVFKIRASTDAGGTQAEPFRFTRSTGVTDLQQTGVTGVLVPVPTAAGQALRWGSDAEVAALTATGNVTVTKDTPEVAVDTATAASSSVISFKVAGVRRFAFVRNHIGAEADNLTLNKYSAAGAYEFQPWKVTRAGAVEMDGAWAVTVPVPTAAGQALRWGSNATVNILTSTFRTVVENANPEIRLVETDQPADNQMVRLTLGGGYIQLRTASDSGATQQEPFRFNRATGETSLAETGVVSVKVPAPTGANQALRWGSDAEVAALTATGNIATTGVDVTSNYPQLLLYEADGTVNSRKLSLGITNSTAYLRVFNDAGSVVREFIRFGMESAIMDMSVSTSVVVPAPTGARQAAQTTAIDATTGRMAINGYEMGDTGWRDVSSLLVNGWVGSAQLRRVGGVCELKFNNLDPAAATNQNVLTIPSGFRQSGATPAVTALACGTSATSIIGSTVQLCNYAGTATSHAVRVDNSAPNPCRGNLVWTASSTWPTSLPGTPVATATARPGPNPNLRAED